MASKRDQMLRSGAISNNAAKLFTKKGALEDPSKGQRTGKMVPFASKTSDQGGVGKGSKGPKVTNREAIDNGNVRSNVSKGGGAGLNREPAQAKPSGINRGKGQKGAPGGKIAKRKITYKNKAAIYPSGPLAGGPAGRP